MGLVLTMLSSLFVGAASAGPQPLATGERVVMQDAFEGGFPAGGWTVTDANASGGDDHWGPSTARYAGGATSVWVAASGSHTDTVTVLAEDFESGALPEGWAAWDQDPSYGDDYWGVSTLRAASGSYSLWCAQVGDNDQWADGGKGDASALDVPPNSAVGVYDDYMVAYASADVDLSGLSSATFSFNYWLDSEEGYDYFSPAYYAYSSWYTLETLDGYSGGWVQQSYALPVYATAVGFLFESDEYYVQTGAFVDDIAVTGYQVTNNTQSRLYDNGMDTTMARAVSLVGFESAHLDFSYWVQAAGPGDFLEVRYLASGEWQTAQLLGGTSAGWQSLVVPLPATTTSVAFRFVSDDTGRSEGAYIDDVRVVGYVSPLSCEPSVSGLTGIESMTAFVYRVDVTGGLRPLQYMWTFGDGVTSTLAVPTRVFSQTGNLEAQVVVRDALGQACSPWAPSVTVGHDMSSLLVQPASATVTEGSSISFAAFDARGHSLDWQWSVEPASCGAIQTDGAQAIFTAPDQGGGTTCSVVAAKGEYTVAAPVEIAHDFSAPVVLPAHPEVVEGKSVEFVLVDTFGERVAAEWLASCGQLVAGADGTSAVFTANTLGGNKCTVTATAFGHDVQAEATVVHDTATVQLSPSERTVTEGSAVEYTAKDALGHPLLAAWTVEPAACGVFNNPSGPRSTLSVAAGAGGLTCTVRASAGVAGQTSSLSVTHAVDHGSVSPEAAVVPVGKTVQFTALDTMGHPMAARWSVAPMECGALAPAEAATATFTAREGSSGMMCTVTAVAGYLTLRAQVSLAGGAAAAIDVTFPALEALGTAVAHAKVTDAAGNTLDAATVAWTTTCGAVAPATGDHTTVTASAEAGGTTCTVTATLGTLARTVGVQVAYAGPVTATVTASREAMAPGEQATLTVHVTDGLGRAVDPETVSWTAPCGDIEGAGATVTYTARETGGLGACAVEATVSAGGTMASGSASIAVAGASGSEMLAIGVGAAGIAAVLAVALVVRRQRHNR